MRGHAHHILFKKGLGVQQQALVAKGQEILLRREIDPIFGKENLVWAPRVTGQHHIDTLKPLVQTLERLDADPLAVRADFVKVLERHGKLAAERK